MLDTISWGEFLKGIGTVLILYYGVVFIRYFRSDVSSFLIKVSRREQPCSFGRSENGTGASAMQRVGDLLLEIDQEIIPKAQTKQELIEHLRSILLRSELPDDPHIRGILISHMLLASKVRHLEITQEELLDLLSKP
ncbi:hypothetical protein [Algoriphagus aquimarinus]|uniref:Uncharacterized protein n=1 Tax=Algoriphagus aquimarinus TaxID=237018 RepID=A0A5C7AHP4_9BACT|nr:hypothetical protein [Algoriphagus aquimarinus]TXE04758.1 hypothetical protein ESV85_18635 [Algoriphagus aquimarinus]